MTLQPQMAIECQQNKIEAVKALKKLSYANANNEGQTKKKTAIKANGPP